MATASLSTPPFTPLIQRLSKEVDAKVWHKMALTCREDGIINEERIVLACSPVRQVQPRSALLRRFIAAARTLELTVERLL